jgi:hypothetical protein
MSGPGWLPDGFAALMILTAAYCAGRLAACRLLGKRTEMGADLLHVLMGVAMAGMFEPGLSPVPGSIWRAVFTASAAWFGWQALRARSRSPARSWTASPVPHAVESAAMTYVFWSATPLSRSGAGAPMPGMAAAPGNLALTVVLAVFMIGYILCTAEVLTSPAPASSAWPRLAGSQSRTDLPVLAPRLAACYKITMSIAMSYMLITML